MGFVSVFAIAIGDDWNYLMAMAYRAEGFIAIMFYPAVFIVMNLILLNLFLAILLQNFSIPESDDDQEENDDESRAFGKIRKKVSNCYITCSDRCGKAFPCFYTYDSDE